VSGHPLREFCRKSKEKFAAVGGVIHAHLSCRWTRFRRDIESESRMNARLTNQSRVGDLRRQALTECGGRRNSINTIRLELADGQRIPPRRESRRPPRGGRAQPPPTHPFFDGRDLVQVKYEMLRRVQRESGSVTQAAADFGFSRVSFYQAQAAFAAGGLPGLVPRRRGPRGAHKLTEEVMVFLDQARAAAPELSSRDLAGRVQERFGLAVHPRSIERAFERRLKKPPSPLR
jgi:transposase